LPPGNRLLPWTEAVEGGARVIVREAHLDTWRAHALGEYLLALAGRVNGGLLEVDLGEVAYLCATCLGKLIALDRRLRALGGRLALLNVAAAVYEVFEVTHLLDVLDVRGAA
jgi:anti-anti-sigma factor